MAMTHNELCNIETVMQRAVNAAKQFASGPDVRQLNAGMYLLAEVRNAGMFLCDPGTSRELQMDVLETLVCAITKGKL